MTYHALARKYRPSTFEEMVGQEHVTRTLRAALRNEKLSHAYLFSGPRGCGKTTVARLLAKALNCSAGAADEPCGSCESCTGIAAGTWLDVLEIDAASHTGVDNIRELRDMAQYSPSQGQSRVFIIDEVHMLSKGAFNALLKILEEPPARVFFFFATTEPNRIPRTILSRCQRFDFRLLTRDELTARLEEIVAAEGMTIDPGGLRLVVSQAEGSMRDAQSLLDQVLAACEGEVTEQAVVDLFGLVQSDLFTDMNEAMLAGDAGAALHIADRVSAAGQSLDDFAQQLVTNLRNLMLLRVDPDLAVGISLPEEQIAVLRGQAERFAPQDLLALLDRASRGYERIHRSTQPRVVLEALLVELALMESRVLLSDLVRRLDALGAGGGAGSTGGGARPGGASVSRDSGGRAPERTAPRARPAAHVEAAAPPPMASGPEDLPTVNAGGEAFRAAAASTVEGWQGFVMSLMTTNPGVGACVIEGVPVERDGALALTFPREKEFHLQRIQQDLPLLSAESEKHLGKRIVLELVDGDHEARTEHREDLRKTVAPTEPETLAKARREDDALDRLVDLIDGEVVPEAEREEWLRRPGNNNRPS